MNTIDNNSIYKPVQAKNIYRLAAFVMDLILFIILMTGFLYLCSLIMKFDSHNQILHEQYRNIGYEIFNEEKSTYEYIALDDPNFESVIAAYSENEIILREETFINSFVLNAPIISIFITLFILEIIIPLILKNGQTIGMKCFHIGLISNNSIAVKPLQIFIRGLFGKIVVLSVLVYMGLFYSFFYHTGGLFGTVIVLVVAIGNTALLIGTKRHTGIQDIISQVYPVDASQVVFYQTEAELKAALSIEDKSRKERRKVY